MNNLQRLALCLALTGAGVLTLHAQAKAGSFSIRVYEHDGKGNTLITSETVTVNLYDFKGRPVPGWAPQTSPRTGEIPTFSVPALPAAPGDNRIILKFTRNTDLPGGVNLTMAGLLGTFSGTQTLDVIVPKRSHATSDVSGGGAACPCAERPCDSQRRCCGRRLIFRGRCGR